MGTNYYLRKKCSPTFPASVGCYDGAECEPRSIRNGWIIRNYYYPALEDCKDFYQEYHIGKSSGGWYFALAIYPEYGINNLNDWKQLFMNPDNSIYNEYGEKINVGDMLQLITNKQGTWPDNASTEQKEEFRQKALFSANTNSKIAPFVSYDQYLNYNGATEGVKGLWRHNDRLVVPELEDSNYTFDYIVSGNDPEKGCIFS